MLPMAIKFKGFTYEEVPRFRLAEGRSASDMIRSLRVTVNEMETDPDFLENVPVRVEPYVENLKAHAKELSAIRNKEVEEWPHDLWKWAKQMDLSAVNGRLSPEHFGRFLRLVRGIANAYKRLDARI
jgi:3-deoxy-D-manno-octulosonic-acid transferase